MTEEQTVVASTAGAVVAALRERPAIVFFDVGDTLMRVDPSWTGAYLAAARSWGLDVSERALASAFAKALGEGLWDSLGPFEPTPESSYQRIKQFDVRAMALLGHEDLPDEFYRHLGRFFERRGAWHVFPDAHPTLVALERAGYRRAVISNWVWALPELLHDVELAHHFEAIVASARVGFVKPQPQIFEHALQLTGVRPESAIHVGDNPDADVAGASAVGIRPVLLDRGGRFRGGLSGRPDVPVIADLLGLLPLLGCEQVSAEEATRSTAEATRAAAGDRVAGDVIGDAIRRMQTDGSAAPDPGASIRRARPRTDEEAAAGRAEPLPVVDETWRLFVAVPVPDGIRSAVGAAIAPLRSRFQARWQSPETWHLTLRFLGDTPVGEVAAVESAVRVAAEVVAPFEVELGDAGSFGHRRGGDVVWVGVGRGREQLAMLERALRERIPEPEAERGPFRAHLTIAREASTDLAAAMGAALTAARRTVRAGSVGLGTGAPSVAGFAWRADRLVLYRSVLGRGGATHTELVSVPLGAADPSNRR